MKLKDPYTGATIDAADGAVERLLAHGFLKAEAPKKADKTEKVEKAETKRKKG